MFKPKNRMLSNGVLCKTKMKFLRSHVFMAKTLYCKILCAHEDSQSVNWRVTGTCCASGWWSAAKNRGSLAVLRAQISHSEKYPCKIRRILHASTPLSSLGRSMHSLVAFVELTPKKIDVSRNSARPQFSKIVLTADIPASPSLTTIAWSEKDDTATEMPLSKSHRIIDQTDCTPLQDQNDKNRQGRRTWVEHSPADACRYIPLNGVMCAIHAVAWRCILLHAVCLSSGASPSANGGPCRKHNFGSASPGG